jgi:hypothetical protein
MELAQRSCQGEHSVDPEASSVHRTGGIKLYKVPSIVRTEDAVTVKLIAELVGKVVAVDELSLTRGLGRVGWVETVSVKI